ncbi:hypothetical protein IT575_13730 [bacterium]|nr:hypothetical protein [bacterium]
MEYKHQISAAERHLPSLERAFKMAGFDQLGTGLGDPGMCVFDVTISIKEPIEMLQSIDSAIAKIADPIKLQAIMMEGLSFSAIVKDLIFENIHNQMIERILTAARVALPDNTAFYLDGVVQTSGDE